MTPDLTRRSALRALVGAATLTVPATALASDDTIPTHDLTSAEAQFKIADRMHDLCSELSFIMTNVDGARWYARVCPHFMGQPNYQIQPMETPPMLRLQQALSMAAAALNEMQPGHWRQDFSLEGGFAIVTNNNWRRE